MDLQIVHNLPAGEYLTTTVADVEDGEWFDPALLESASGDALKVVLTAGAPAVQDLRSR